MSWPGSGESVRRTVDADTGHRPPTLRRRSPRPSRSRGSRRSRRASLVTKCVRVTSPSRDELQLVMAFLRGEDFEYRAQVWQLPRAERRALVGARCCSRPRRASAARSSVPSAPVICGWRRVERSLLLRHRSRGRAPQRSIDIGGVGRPHREWSLITRSWLARLAPGIVAKATPRPGKVLLSGAGTRRPRRGHDPRAPGRAGRVGAGRTGSDYRGDVVLIRDQTGIDGRSTAWASRTISPAS